MTTGFDPARYNAGARLLHWLIAVLMIANLLTGLFHDALKRQRTFILVLFLPS